LLDLAQHTIYRVQSDEDYSLNPSLFDRTNETFSAFDYILKQGYDKWLITFSGGKDSTLTLVLALEYILKNPGKVKRIDIVYSDTLLEIPSIHEFANKFLCYIKISERLNHIPINIHIVYPELEERFWVKVLGKGYPPPHQKFRWCTKRLKIDPCEKAMNEFMIPNETAVLTGVRFGESNSRDQRLNASCSRGGECGQGLWFEKSKSLKVGYLAPIINWPVCEVWDYLIGFAPLLGYPTGSLKKVYNGHDTRFGCWTCTVVKQDKAMARTIKQKEWTHLQPLYDFRNHLWESTRPRETRVLRKDGTVSKIKIEFRKKILKELLSIQDITGSQLISIEEIKFIKHLWNIEKSNS